MRRDREERILRQLRSREEQRALNRLSEIAESGGALVSERDIEDAILAMRALGKRFDADAVRRELERGGWTTRIEGRLVVKKPIPISVLGEIIKGS